MEERVTFLRGGLLLQAGMLGAADSERDRWWFSILSFLVVMTGRADVPANWPCVVTCQEYLLTGLHPSMGRHQIYVVMGINSLGLTV